MRIVHGKSNKFLNLNYNTERLKLPGKQESKPGKCQRKFKNFRIITHSMFDHVAHIWKLCEYKIW